MSGNCSGLESIQFVMDYQFSPLFGNSTDEQIEDHFDDDVRRIIMETKSPCQALMKSKTLEEEGNKLFKTKDYWLALNTYEKAM